MARYPARSSAPVAYKTLRVRRAPRGSVDARHRDDNSVGVGLCEMPATDGDEHSLPPASATHPAGLSHRRGVDGGDLRSDDVAGGAGGVGAGAVNGVSGAGPTDRDLVRPAAATAVAGRADSSDPRPTRNDNLLLLLSVSVIAACCLCWFLEHLDYLLKPLVFALGLSLILRPFVDFLSDARYQEQKLRRWNVRPPWSPRVAVVPRFVALILALSAVMLLCFTFIWALYLSEQWITYHWKDKAWNDRFIARINDLADFTDRIALRLLKKDDFAMDAWHTLQTKTEELLKEESFWHGVISRPRPVPSPPFFCPFSFFSFFSSCLRVCVNK